MATNGNTDSDIVVVPKESKLNYGGFSQGANATDDRAIRKASVAAMTVNVTGEIKNPLLGIPKHQLFADVDTFAQTYGMQEQLTLLRKGALIAQNPADFGQLYRSSVSAPAVLLTFMM
ncbi:hypothetical protein LTR35_017698 [Friedmanniomyces endolithicus]|nr:hypothetical protein LTR35_017698 [Friedmanniomyces endolithicus]